MKDLKRRGFKTHITSRENAEFVVSKTLSKPVNTEPTCNVNTEDDMNQMNRSYFEQHDKKCNAYFTELRNAISDINFKIEELYQRLEC